VRRFHSTTDIPANLPKFPDLLDVGATVRGRHQDTRGVVVRVNPLRVWDDATGRDTGPEPKLLLLDLTHWTGRTQLARVLTVGAKCATCVGSGWRAVPGVIPPSVGRQSCGCANGHLRPPHPVRHLLPAQEMGDLPPEHPEWSPGLLACSAWRVSVGLNPVVGILGEYSRSHGTRNRSVISGKGGGWGFVLRVFDSARELADVRTQGGSFEDFPGWRCAPGEIDKPAPLWWKSSFGPETGDAGKAAADAAALAAGFALANADGTLTLPWPP
jgi:hypothetical protein